MIVYNARATADGINFVQGRRLYGGLANTTKRAVVKSQCLKTSINTWCKTRLQNGEFYI